MHPQRHGLHEYASGARIDQSRLSGLGLLLPGPTRVTQVIVARQAKVRKPEALDKPQGGLLGDLPEGERGGVDQARTHGRDGKADRCYCPALR